jgi:hypothetical protein
MTTAILLFLLKNFCFLRIYIPKKDFVICSRRFASIVGWAQIRAPIVGFRSSTQPTKIVCRAYFDTRIETQRRY